MQRFDRWLQAGAAREAIVLWAICFALIAAAFPVSRTLAKLVATLGFLYLPEVSMRRRGEGFREYGVSVKPRPGEVKLTLLLLAAILPTFVAAYWGFAQVLPQLPEALQRLLAPYTGAGHFHFKLPDRFAEWVIDQYFVVALPEEFFYRGFVQTRLRDAWPQGRMFLGARLGPAFWLTAVLFALGHLAIFEVWRLGVFFPALLFGWLRERTGSVMGAAFLHGTFNLTMLVLEASFYGR
ncbi:MAG: CPBP family intramembrane metalloprotease [Archangiaceae bacterium]|nr:CPBP family intramembrane metalloprotease [Archangiaceae bacterium]